VEKVKEWILSEGRVISDPLSFIEQLCERIEKSGISLARLRIGFRTIHPQIDIWAFTWTNENRKADLWGGEHGIRASSKYYGSPAEWVHTHNKPFRRRLTDLDPTKDHKILFEQQEIGLTDYLMCPMEFIDGSHAVISFVTATDEGFSDQDLSELESLVGFIAPIIEVHSTRKIAITLLDTYVGHRSGERVMNGHIQRGDGDVIEAALWFSDLRQYTELSENLDHLQIFGLLNSYFQTLSDVVTPHGGEILKFIGDAALVIFPVDQETSAQKACENALSAATEMFKRIVAENKERQVSKNPEINFGIGLHFGKAIYGNVGALDRLDFTVTGPAVNLASRVESLTKETGKQLLLSQTFVEKLKTETLKIGEFDLKGIRERQVIYSLPA